MRFRDPQLKVDSDWTGVTYVGSEVRELTPEEGWAILDVNAQAELGISGEEFLRRFDAGTLPTEDECPAISRVIMLIPFAR